MNPIIIPLALIAVFFCIPVANAELLSIEAGNDKHGIFLSIEDNESIIIWETATGFSEHFDSKLKMYPSGGFSLKNPESGIAVWGHQKGKTWDLFILTNDGIVRLMGQSIFFDNVEPLKVTNATTTTIEPKNSIGADITKWDIPTEGRTNHQYVAPEKVFDPNTLKIISSVPKSVQYKHNLNFDFSVVDTTVKSEKDQKIENANVEILMINPLGKSIQQWRGTTNSLGSFGDSWFVVDNEIIGEYTLNVTAAFEDFTKKSTLVSFFVTPIDENSARKCPANHIQNSIGICVEIIE